MSFSDLTAIYNTLKSNKVDIRFNAIANAFPNCNIVRGYEGVQDCDIAIIQGWSKKKGEGGSSRRDEADCASRDG